MKRYLALLFVLASASLPAIAQTCSTFPCVVASVSLTGQTSPIKPTPIFTPANAGVFRVTVSMVLTHASAGNSNPRFNTIVQWIDETGHIEQGTYYWPLVVTAAPPYAVTSNTFTFQAAAAQPIEYGVGGGRKGAVYSVYVIVEQLQ
jgi:hypothetical protein